VRSIVGLGGALALALALNACGGSSSSSSSSTSKSSAGGSGKNVPLRMGTAPDSLDPGFGYTTQAAEPDWLAYTGLVTYAHMNGTGGGNLIPGLATALPAISDGG